MEEEDLTKAMIGTKVALIILNSNYSSTSHSSMNSVTEDGKLMAGMLSSYNNVKLVKDASDIELEVKKFTEKYKNSQIECLHFHFSGHGVENSYAKKAGLTSTGDCMIGCSGKLYALHDLKLELMNCKPSLATVTLDCCIDSDINHKEYVRLRNNRAMSTSDQEKIAVIHGTSDLHTSSDAQTFTAELNRVCKEEGGEIPILQIASKVNKSWKDRGIINQICKHDIVEVGNNWTFFMWPASSTIKPQCPLLTGTKNRDKMENLDKRLEDMIRRMERLDVEKQADRERVKELEGMIKRMETLNVERQADKERMQKLETEVLELGEYEGGRKRKIARKPTFLFEHSIN